MPNWVNNELTVMGDAHVLRDFVQRAEGYGPQYEPSEAEMILAGNGPPKTCPLDFNAFVPVPPDVLARGFHAAGFDWEAKHWGIKWGACSTERETPSPWVARYTFRTPWDAPRVWLPKVSVQWPVLRFKLFSWSWESDIVLRATYEGTTVTIEQEIRGHEAFKPWLQQHDPDLYSRLYEQE